MPSQTQTATLVSSSLPGLVPWNNPLDATVCDGLGYAFCTFGPFAFGSSEILIAEAFRFTIPAADTIDGIEARYLRHKLGNDIADTSILIRQAGAPAGVDHATLVDWPLVDAPLLVGGALDLWGVAWTPAQINAADFGVQMVVDCNAGGSGGFVDCIQLTVFFTAPATAGGFLLRGVSPS